MAEETKKTKTAATKPEAKAEASAKNETPKAAGEAKPPKAPKKSAAAPAEGKESKEPKEAKDAKEVKEVKEPKEGDKAKAAPAAAAAAAPAAPTAPAGPAAPLTAAELLADEMATKKIVKAKGSKNIQVGIVNILATFNNTQVSITDMQGHVISWSSAGRVGYKGSRKSTAFAAQQVAQDAARQAMAHGLREVEVRVHGPGSGREAAIRALQTIGLEITVIKDATPVPHNGCRPRKKRRV